MSLTSTASSVARVLGGGLVKFALVGHVVEYGFRLVLMLCFCVVGLCPVGSGRLGVPVI